MDPVREQDVEVPFGDVRAGVADLVGAPAALERAQDLARRTGIDADAVRRAGRAERAEDPRTSGRGLALSANRRRYGSPDGANAAWMRRAFSANRGAVIDEQWRAALAGQSLRRPRRRW